MQQFTNISEGTPSPALVPEESMVAGATETTAVASEEDWTRKYKAALLERNSRLLELRVDEAHKAIIEREKEIPHSCDERRKLAKAITVLRMLQEGY